LVFHQRCLSCMTIDAIFQLTAPDANQRIAAGGSAWHWWQDDADRCAKQEFKTVRCPFWVSGKRRSPVQLVGNTPHMCGKYSSQLLVLLTFLRVRRSPVQLAATRHHHMCGKYLSRCSCCALNSVYCCSPA
jgi:hypothetical protein